MLLCYLGLQFKCASGRPAFRYSPWLWWAVLGKKGLQALPTKWKYFHFLKSSLPLPSPGKLIAAVFPEPLLRSKLSEGRWLGLDVKMLNIILWKFKTLEMSFNLQNDYCFRWKCLDSKKCSPDEIWKNILKTIGMGAGVRRKLMLFFTCKHLVHPVSLSSMLPILGYIRVIFGII